MSVREQDGAQSWGDGYMHPEGLVGEKPLLTEGRQPDSHESWWVWSFHNTPQWAGQATSGLGEGLAPEVTQGTVLAGAKAALAQPLHFCLCFLN